MSCEGEDLGKKRETQRTEKTDAFGTMLEGKEGVDVE